MADSGATRRGLEVLSLGLLMLTSSVGVTVWSPPTRAAEAADESSAEPADDNGTAPQSSGGGLAEVTVTARRREELLKDVPLSVTAITPAELTAMHIQTQQDLQRTVPGLVVRSYFGGNLANFNLRGQGLDISTSAQPAVLPYVNEFQFSAVGPSSYYDLDSLQVVKGPQGALFGRNTTGGAVLLTTAEPNYEGIDGFIQARAGNFNERAYQGVVNLPITDTLAIRLAGDHLQRDGYVKNVVNNQYLSDTKKNSGRVSIRWSPIDGLESLLVGEITKRHGHGDAKILREVYPVGSTAPNGTPLNSTFATFYTPFLNTVTGNPNAFASLLSVSPGAPACGVTCLVNALPPWQTAWNVPNTYSYFESEYIMNRTTYKINEKLTLKNIIGYADSNEHDTHDDDQTAFPFAVETYYDGTRQMSEELQLSGSLFNDTLPFITGVYYYKGKIADREAPYAILDAGPVANAILGFPVTGFVKGRSHAEGESVYGNGDYKLDWITHGLKVSGGFRYSWERVDYTSFAFAGFPSGVEEHRDDAQPSWQIGLQYAPNDNLQFYLTHRRSWRSGGFSVNSPPIQALGINGGNMFLPEKAKDIELGLKYENHDLPVPLSLSAAIYQIWVNDLLRPLYLLIDNSPVSTSYNIPQTTTYPGAELQLSLLPFSWLEVGVNASYIKPKYPSNFATVFGAPVVFDTFADTTRVQGSAFGQGTFPLPNNLGSLVLRADVYAQTSMYYTNQGLSYNYGAQIPGYATLNVRATWKDIAGSHVSVSGYATNATNRYYFIGGGNNGTQLGFNDVVPGEPRFYGAEIRYDF